MPNVHGFKRSAQKASCQQERPETNHKNTADKMKDKIHDPGAFLIFEESGNTAPEEDAQQPEPCKQKSPLSWTFCMVLAIES